MLHTLDIRMPYRHHPFTVSLGNSALLSYAMNIRLKSLVRIRRKEIDGCTAGDISSHESA